MELRGGGLSLAPAKIPEKRHEEELAAASAIQLDSWSSLGFHDMPRALRGSKTWNHQFWTRIPLMLQIIDPYGGCICWILPELWVIDQLQHNVPSREEVLFNGSSGLRSEALTLRCKVASVRVML